MITVLTFTEKSDFQNRFQKLKCRNCVCNEFRCRIWLKLKFIDLNLTKNLLKFVFTFCSGTFFFSTAQFWLNTQKKNSRGVAIRWRRCFNRKCGCRYAKCQTNFLLLTKMLPVAALVFVCRM